MTTVEIITLVIGIITIVSTTFFMCNLEDKKTLTSSKAQTFLNFTFILSTFLGLFISISLYERRLNVIPTALDVYRDKTVLNINITYQDGNIIECDSTVTFKSDSVKLSEKQ
jgi:hypothetical protein